MRSRFVSPGLILLAVLTLLDLPLQGCSPALETVIPSHSERLSIAQRRTVTVLPISLTMEAEQPAGRVSRAASFEAAGRALPILTEAARHQLAARGWNLTPVDWDGTISDGKGGSRRPSAIDAIGLANLTDWLVAYTDGILTHPADATDEMVFPPLPFPTDVTLFIGGHAHLHEDSPHRNQVAADVAIGIAITLVVIATIALFAAALKGGGGLHLPSLGSGLGELAVRAITLPIQLGTRVGLAAARSSLDVSDLVPPSHVESAHCNAYLGVHDGIVYGNAEQAPSELRQNVLALGATLVENRTGRVLWSAGQAMPVDPVDGYELRASMKHLLEKLPPGEGRAPRVATR